jgi:hypothetical protein
MRNLGGFFRIAISLLLFLGTLWCAAALAIDGPLRGNAATILGVSWVLFGLAIAFALRPFRRVLFVVLLCDLAVAGWWLAIPPSNDRAWLPEVAELPRVDFDGDEATIHNVRNFAWHSETDFTPVWEDRTYDLSQVRGADIFFSYWGAPVAHTIVSWEFADGRHLAISIETRKEVGEEYSAILGFFRQFELYYVVADERDVIGVRTDYRGEKVFLYHLVLEPQAARAFLQDYLERVNELAVAPSWYNAATQNCTTTIWRHARHLDSNIKWDWRVLANGTGDAMLYARGRLDRSLPFEELKRRSEITEAARGAGSDEKFSALIRKGLPGGNAAP